MSIQEMKYWFYYRNREKFLFWLAHKMPKPLRYAATIVSCAEATTGEYGDTEVPSLLMVDMLKRQKVGF